MTHRNAHHEAQSAGHGPPSRAPPRCRAFRTSFRAPDAGDFHRWSGPSGVDRWLVPADREEAQHQSPVRGHELPDQSREDAVQQGRVRPWTLTMMDDPRPHPGRARESSSRSSPPDVTNLADVIPEAKTPRRHVGETGASRCAASRTNTKALPNGPRRPTPRPGSHASRSASSSSRCASRRRSRRCWAATHYVTKKPLAKCLPEWQAGIARMKELRPNIMQVSTNYPAGAAAERDRRIAISS